MVVMLETLKGLLKEYKDELPHFQIIPKGRAKKDADAYKFLSWWIRRHKKDIGTEALRQLRESLLYGKASVTPWR